MATSLSAHTPLTVLTVLTPTERARVDAAGAGVYQTTHRDCVEDVMRDLRAQPVAAVLVSVGRCDTLTTTRLGRMVREFPRVPAFALLSQVETQSARAAMALGSCGIRRLVDVTQPNGWHELRAVLASDHGAEIRRAAIDSLIHDLGQAPPGCQRFFESLFSCDDDVVTVRSLARMLGVVPSTMMSRFFRASLPAPKRYLSHARLVRAARLLENPGVSIAKAAHQLEYSSPQSFGRHVRMLLRMPAGEFRRRYDGRGMLDRFREDLILPYRARLLTFEPL